MDCPDCKLPWTGFDVGLACPSCGLTVEDVETGAALFDRLVDDAAPSREWDGAPGTTRRLLPGSDR
jgi:hypothetical protein